MGCLGKMSGSYHVHQVAYNALQQFIYYLKELNRIYSFVSLPEAMSWWSAGDFV